MIATIPEKSQKKNQFAQQSSPLREKKYFGLCLIIDENNYKRSRYLDCPNAGLYQTITSTC